MQITQLVVLFNKDKIIAGVLLSVLLSALYFAFDYAWSWVLLVLAAVVICNILLALYASYQLYDRSDLYRPKKLLKDMAITDVDKVIMLHASFDPISSKLEELMGPDKLKIYNLYGNRHEDEASVKISNRVFPPNPRQVIVDPKQLPDKDNSIDYILAITAAHEILRQEDRIAFFKEAKRVLKSGGRLILCEQMRNTINFIFFNIGAFHFVKGNDWQVAIDKAGLTVIRKEQLTAWAEVWHISNE